MGAIEDAINEPIRRGGRSLLVAEHLDAMTPKKRKAAEALLATKHSDRFVAEMFSTDGYACSAGAVRTWRDRRRQGKA